MTTQAILQTMTLTSTATLVKHRYVDLDGGYSTAAGNGFGVTAETVSNIGDDFLAILQGKTIVEGGGAIALDAFVEIGTDGKVVTLAAGVKVGRCVKAIASDGDLTEIIQFLN